ncbi:MAG: DUF58 domain-containing protein [Proteobacteria bacterium]|nr:DUF58 domain-containing protein [Pseudomonadota bacterium]
MATPSPSAFTRPAAPSWLGGWWQRKRASLFRHTPGDGRPVVLRHSRIYVLPTRRGLALMATLAVMLVASLNYALSLGFVVTFLLAGMLGAALLHTFRNIAGLTVTPLGAGEAFAGGTLSYALALAGGTHPRVAVRLAATGAGEVVVDVPAGTGLHVSLARTAERRGRQALGRVTLSSDYPVGLWRAWAYLHFPLSGLVFPAPEPGAPPLPGGSEGPDSRESGRSDAADLAGLRTYVAGDPLSRVAWKAVARGSGWYTKQFDGASGGGPVALDWFELPEGLDPELRIARLTAWVLAAEHAARPFGLRLPGQALTAASGREHRRAVLKALALFEP